MTSARVWSSPRTRARLLQCLLLLFLPLCLLINLVVESVFDSVTATICTTAAAVCHIIVLATVWVWLARSKCPRCRQNPMSVWLFMGMPFVIRIPTACANCGEPVDGQVQ
jgi:hypothetical protein